MSSLTVHMSGVTLTKCMLWFAIYNILFRKKSYSLLSLFTSSLHECMCMAKKDNLINEIMFAFKRMFLFICLFIQYKNIDKIYLKKSYLCSHCSLHPCTVARARMDTITSGQKTH